MQGLYCGCYGNYAIKVPKELNESRLHKLQCIMPRSNCKGRLPYHRIAIAAIALPVRIGHSAELQQLRYVRTGHSAELP